jgi:glycosyltransferase involved in cell wall biosynthesis
MHQPQSLKIAHLISLDTIGGIERDYSQFINFQPAMMDVEHHTLLVKTKLAPAIKPLVEKQPRSLQRLSAYQGIKIPRWPSVLRRYHRKRILAKIAPDLILIWSRPRSIDLLDGIFDSTIVYYEHGAAWLKKDDPDDQAVMQRLFQRVAGVICNSQAARRVIELRWAPEAHTDIRVCLNAIRPDCLPTTDSFKSLPDSRPLRLGCAGRFMEIKGFPLAIHAVNLLKQRGIACELYLAGTGGELAKCRELVNKLNLQGRVKFLGLVKDMSEFFQFIDCFLCPSIREPFGLVSAEAMAHGCPVIASRVDGLPEVVREAETGYCIPPELPLVEYRKFGGSLNKIPLYVYNPDRDRLETPKIIDPAHIADRVETIISTPENFQRMSAAAGQTAFEKFNYSNHAQQVLDTLVRIADHRK